MILSDRGFLLFQRLLGLYLGFIFYSYFEASAQMGPDVVFDLGVSRSPFLVNLFSDPATSRILCFGMMGASALLVANIIPVIAALSLFYGWLCQLQSFPYLTPHDPYVGWLILAVCVFPRGERSGPEKISSRSLLFWGGVLILGVTYCLSGIDKLRSLAWTRGLALEYVLTSPIARWPLSESLLDALGGGLHLVLRGLTFLILGLEILFLPLFFFPPTQKWTWLIMTCVHLVNLFALQIPAVSVGMLLFHLFVSRRDWLPGGRKNRP